MENLTVKDILEQIAATSSRKAKEDILKRHSHRNDLYKTCWFAYNPDINFWVRSVPEKYDSFSSIPLESAIHLLIEQVASRKKTGQEAIDYILLLKSNLCKKDADVIDMILDRDLRAGFQVNTINKIWLDKPIPTYECMLCSTDKSSLKFPNVITQEKMDGVRILISHSESGDILFRTRNGKFITTLYVYGEKLKGVISKGETWDGELVCYGKDGKPIDRKTSNGIINKAIKGTITELEVDMVRFCPWDIIDFTGTIPYIERFNRLLQIIEGSEYIIPIKYKMTPFIEDVYDLFNIIIQEGGEGVVAKNADSKWSNKRSKDLVKFKAEETCELEVIEEVEGTGKYVGMLGALTCKTADGKLIVNIGSGFSDEQREEYKEGMKGKIIEVLYNAVITKKGSGTSSLFLPRFLRIREDKNEANSLEDLLGSTKVDLDHVMKVDVLEVSGYTLHMS